MPVQVKYCDKCKKKIPMRELQHKEAVEYKDYSFCKSCFQKMPEKIQSKIQHKLKLSTLSSKKGSPRASHSCSGPSGHFLKSAKRSSFSHLPAQDASQSFTSGEITTFLEKKFAPSSPSPQPASSPALSPPPSKRFPLWFGGALGIFVVLIAFFLLWPSSPSSKQQWQERYLQALRYQRSHPTDYEGQKKRFLSLLSSAPSPRWREEVRFQLLRLTTSTSSSPNTALPSPQTKEAPRPKGEKTKKPLHKPFRNFRRFRNSKNFTPSSARNSRDIQDAPYVGSKFKYHRRSCRAVKRIKKWNLRYFSTKEEAEKAGKKPCRACKP